MSKHFDPMNFRRGIPAPYPRADAGAGISQEVRDLIASIQKNLHDMRQENDAAIAEIKKKGAPDPVQTEKVDRINNSVTELKTLYDNLSAQIARATVGGGEQTASGGMTRAQAATRFAREVQASAFNRRLPHNHVADVAQYDAYCAAFDELLRVNGNVDALKPDVRAALYVGSDPGGGYWVPTETSTQMERRIHDTSPMRQIARVIRIGTGRWEAPWMTAKGTSGGWVGERQARTATATPTTGMQTIDVHEQYAYPEVTQTMLDDAVIDVAGFITGVTEEEMIRQENTAFVSGDGVMKPKGFMTYKTGAVTTTDPTRDWGKLQYVVSGAAAGFPTISGLPGASNVDKVIDLITELHPDYRAGAQFVMSRRTEAAFRKVKDGNNNYLVGTGLMDSRLQFNIFGFGITNLEDMEALASDSFSAAFGNFRRGYYIIDRIGFRMLRDPYTNKPYVGFYITKRVGGDVRNFDAIKLMKFGTS